MNETEQREAAKAALEHMEQHYPNTHARFIETARKVGFDDPVTAMLAVGKLFSRFRAEATKQ